MASASEREIRDAVATSLRNQLPGARIVHELKIDGGNVRLDLAAITETAVIGVEIKSERDTLKRLDRQVKAGRKICHKMIVVAHEKHFFESDQSRHNSDLASPMRLSHPMFAEHFDFGQDVWRYPMPESGPRFYSIWNVGNETFRKQPGASSLLSLLWKEELLAECRRHDLKSLTRLRRYDMIHDMAWNLTGRQVTEAVCRQLRARPFAEADAPIRIEQ